MDKCEIKYNVSTYIILLCIQTLNSQVDNNF